MTARALRAGAMALAVALPFGVLGIVLALGTNLPWLDEWEWTDLLYHAHAGSLTFAELWKPHNEHRIIVADLVMLGLARLGGWNIVREQVFSLAMVAAAQIVVWRLLVRTAGAPLVPPAFLAASLLLYSIGQVDNFANGFQLGWPICTFALVLCALLLTAPERRAWHVVAAGAAALAASFSSSQGLLIWPVGAFLLLFAPKRSTAALAGWIVAGTAAFLADRSGSVGGSHATAHDLGALAAYALAYLGAPVASFGRVPSATAAGALALAALVAAAVNEVRLSGALALARRLPWYGLALYAVLGALATAAGRFDLGPEQALSSRYVSVSSMLYLALIGIAATYAAPAIRPIVRRAALALVAVIAAATIPASTAGFAYWVRYHDARQNDLRALRAGDDAALGDLYPNADELARFLRELRELHDGPFRS